MNKSVLGTTGLALLLMVLQAAAAPAGSSFAYHGRLSTNGVPANGAFDFIFTLVDAETAGEAVSATVTNTSVTVINGDYSTRLDFGLAPFDGTELWLDIGVKGAASADDYTAVEPRQTLPIAPYSFVALGGATASQLDSVSNSLQAVIVQGLGMTSNSVVDLTQSLSTGLGGRLAATNGMAINTFLSNATMRSSFFAADSSSGSPAITIQNSGRNDLSNVTLQNGWWGAPFNVPVAYFQPVTVGAQMPFDLMPKGPFSADSWMDICDRDVSINNASYWEAVTVYKHADDYAEIGTKTSAGKFRDLYLQQRAVPFGGKLGVGAFDSALRPQYMTQIRPADGINLGIDKAGPGVLLASVNDGNSELKPLSIQASKTLVSADRNVSPLVYFQIHPSSNVNMSVDNVGDKARLAAFNDSGRSNIPIIYQGESHIFTSDSGVSYGMIFSNNTAIAVTAHIEKSLSIGDPESGTAQILSVSSTNRASKPWPAMTAAQRDALRYQPPAGSVILNANTGQPELSDGLGHWNRLGQRLNLATTGAAATVMTNLVDVLLVKGNGLRHVTLPDPGNWPNRVIDIKDSSFAARSGPIVISSPKGKIENGTELVINVDGGTVRLVSDGTDWFKLN